MSVHRISTRGRLTLPAEARRALGLTPGSRVDVFVRDKEIVIRRLLTLDELAGIFYEEGREPIPWEVQRDMAEQACAEEASC